jgi:hypothetical protein
LQREKVSAFFFIIVHVAGLVTMKYIYGPASVGATHDGVIRLENNIGLGRLTMICMPMKGKPTIIL